MPAISISPEMLRFLPNCVRYDTTAGFLDTWVTRYKNKNPNNEIVFKCMFPMKNDAKVIPVSFSFSE